MKRQISILFSLLLSTSLFSAKVDTVMVHSASLGDVKTVIISPEKIKKSMSVLYLLHGCGDNFAKWIRAKPKLKEIADKNNWLIVCPEGRKSWYWNSPLKKDSQYETFMTEELIKYIDTHYKTISSKTGRAITGLSMGGHGAMWLAFRHTDTYGAVGSMSGGVDIRPFPKNWNMSNQLGTYEDNKDVWDRHTVINLVDSIQNKQQAIIFDCGTEDIFFEVNSNLHKKLLEKKIDHDFITRPGGHNWAYWKNSLDFQILFFEKYFDSVQ